MPAKTKTRRADNFDQLAEAAGVVSLRKDSCPNCGKNHRTLTVDDCRDRSMSETKLNDRVIYRLKRDGWRYAHAGRGWVGGDGDGKEIMVTPMSPGWPDLTCAKAGHKLIFIELKAELGEVSTEQLEWLHVLNLAGARAIVIRPSDLRRGIVDHITRVGSPLDG